jgi:DNA-binding transcriptional ArsR family regulator
MRFSTHVPRRARRLKMATKQTKLRNASADFERMANRAKQASEFLKAFSHESRLLILCLLCEGEKSVTELEELLSLPQSSVSQQLARLRLDGLVQPKRNGKAVHYSLANNDTRIILGALHDVFCKKAERRARAKPNSSSYSTKALP